MQPNFQRTGPAPPYNYTLTVQVAIALCRKWKSPSSTSDSPSPTTPSMRSCYLCGSTAKGTPPNNALAAIKLPKTEAPTIHRDRLKARAERPGSPTTILLHHQSAETSLPFRQAMKPNSSSKKKSKQQLGCSAIMVWM